jgi:heat shock protein HslJ
MRPTTTWLVLAGVALALSGCGGITSPAISTPLDGDWQLERGLVDGEALRPPETNRVTLSIGDGEVRGISACNSYGGELDIDGDRLSFSQLWVTEMACSPPEIMELEMSYLTALQRVDQASGEDVLVLSGPDVELRYVEVPQVPTSELVGSSWVLDGLVSGTGPDASVSSVVGEAATLLLTEDGALRGSTGCRKLSGRYTIAGDEVVATELAAEGDCPSEVRAQDSHVVSVIGDGFRVDIEGRRLTVTSRDGAEFVYVADE